jgi:hypothetical protein
MVLVGAFLCDHRLDENAEPRLVASSFGLDEAIRRSDRAIVISFLAPDHCTSSYYTACVTPTQRGARRKTWRRGRVDDARMNWLAIRSDSPSLAASYDGMGFPGDRDHDATV